MKIFKMIRGLFLNPQFDMDFFEPSALGGMMALRHNFVVLVFAPMIMKFGTDMKLDILYATAAKTFMMSLHLRDYDAIICIFADT